MKSTLVVIGFGLAATGLTLVGFWIKCWYDRMKKDIADADYISDIPAGGR